MASFIPKLLTRPKTFTSRLVLVQDTLTNRWRLDPLRSEPTVDEALRAWQAEEKADIQYVSAPAISIYQHPVPTEQTMFVSVSVLYISAVEGASSEQAAKSVDQVAAKAKPNSKSETGVFGPPRK